MVKGLKIGAVVALVVALTSCSNSTDTTAPSTEPVGFANVETDATPTPEPLVAEAPTGDAESAFLAEARLRLGWISATSVIPNATDEQLITSGREGCERIESGEYFEQISLIDGEKVDEYNVYPDSNAILSSAVLNFCPELNVDSSYLPPSD